MFDTIMHQIFDTYLDNDFEGIRPLFQDDWQEEYAELVKFERKHQISRADCTCLECDLLNPILYKAEQKGFSNGFKLAARLLFEICNNPQTEKKNLTKSNGRSNNDLNDKKQDKACNLTLTDAKLLADSVSDSLNLLYEFNVMHSGNSLNEIEMSDGTIFAIKTAAEKLSDIMDTIGTLN